MGAMQGVDELDLSETPFCGCGKCLVGLIRLSSMKETTDSPEKQVEHCREEAAANGGHIIGWAVDLDVSGATNPFTRKGFGPWLRGEKGLYDGIVASAVDRIGRSLVDVLVTAYHLRDTGKLIITHDHPGGPWNLYDPNDEQAFTFKAMMAQSELRSTQRRSKETRERSHKTGRKTGRLAYGYRYVRKGESRKVDHIAIDPKILEVLEEAGDRLLSDPKGKLITPSSEARRLTAAGVLTPSDYRRVLRGLEPLGAPWQATTLTGILTSLATQGYYLEDGRKVFGPDGKPLRIAPAMWSYAKHLALVGRLKPKPLKKTRAPKVNYLGVEVSVCGECGNRLYYQKRQRSEKRTYHDAYQCKARQKGLPGGAACKPSPSMHAEEFETQITKAFLSQFGHLALWEQAFDPGSNEGARLAEARAEREILRSDRMAGVYTSPEDVDYFRENYARLNEEISRLEAVPKRPAHLYWRPTSRTVADAWRDARDDGGRRELMASYGFRVELFRATAPERLKFFTDDPDAAQDARVAAWETHQACIRAEMEYYTRLAAEQAAAEGEEITDTTGYLIPSADEQTAGLCPSEEDGTRVLHLVA